MVSNAFDRFSNISVEIFFVVHGIEYVIGDINNQNPVKIKFLVVTSPVACVICLASYSRKLDSGKYFVYKCF